MGLREMEAWGRTEPTKHTQIQRPAVRVTITWNLGPREDILYKNFPLYPAHKYE